MRICLKELRETEAWLQLIHRLGMADQRGNIERATAEVNELIAIFTKSVLTAARGRNERGVRGE
jgi:four helix bundle protein